MKNSPPVWLSSFLFFRISHIHHGWFSSIDQAVLVTNVPHQCARSCPLCVHRSSEAWQSSPPSEVRSLSAASPGSSSPPSPVLCFFSLARDFGEDVWQLKLSSSCCQRLFLGKVDDSNSYQLLRLSAPDAVIGPWLSLKPWRVELSPLLRSAAIQVGSLPSEFRFAL